MATEHEKNPTAVALASMWKPATMVCAYCGEEFQGRATVRKTGVTGERFCSDSHRTAWHNRRKREAAKAAKAAEPSSPPEPAGNRPG